jgi:hypothetical protein
VFPRTSILPLAAAGAAALLLAARPLRADEPPPPPPPSPALTLHLGAAQIYDSDTHFAGWLDYEFARRIGPFVPLLRLGGAARGEIYAAFGAALPLPLFAGFSFRPSFTAGFYDQGGRRGVDLGFPIEFHTALALSWSPAPSSWRVDLSLSHVSNSRLSHRNHGTELLALGLSFPLP